jgi:hypothetical protein
LANDGRGSGHHSDFSLKVPAKPVNKTGAGSTVCRDHDAAEPAKEHD